MVRNEVGFSKPQERSRFSIITRSGYRQKQRQQRARQNVIILYDAWLTISARNATACRKVLPI